MFPEGQGLVLSPSGELESLYIRGTDTLLTPDQVASCVKFLELIPIEKDGICQCEVKPYEGEKEGLKVNLIGGPTGAGKTSLIHIMAGGMETEPKAGSDTKCPTVYVLKLGGETNETYALLDTAGLCDTAAEASKSVGVQELLINAVAATVRRYKLEMVSFIMCVDMAGRVPGNFADVWPQMHMGLGGDEFSKLCHFVVTKANADSRAEKYKLSRLKETDFYKDLAHSPLKWPVTHAGRENLDGIKKLVKPISAHVTGLRGNFVDPDAQSLATKQMVANQLERRIQELTEQVKAELGAQKSAADSMGQMNEAINEAYEELSSLGWCSEKEKQRLRQLIARKKSELNDIEQKHKSGISSVQQTQQDVDKYVKSFNQEMDTIRKMHGIGAFFKDLVSKVADKALDYGLSKL